MSLKMSERSSSGGSEVTSQRKDVPARLGIELEQDRVRLRLEETCEEVVVGLPVLVGAAELRANAG